MRNRMHLHEGVMPATIRIGVSLVSAVFASCELIRCIFFDASPRGIQGKFSSVVAKDEEGERASKLKFRNRDTRVYMEEIVNGDAFWRSSRKLDSWKHGEFRFNLNIFGQSSLPTGFVES